MKILDELEHLRSEATPGPWKKFHHPGPDVIQIDTIADGYSATICRLTPIIERSMSDWVDSVMSKETQQRNRADAALIVAAVNALPELVAVARAAERLCAGVHVLNTTPQMLGVMHALDLLAARGGKP